MQNTTYRFRLLTRNNGVNLYRLTVVRLDASSAGTKVAISGIKDVQVSDTPATTLNSDSPTSTLEEPVDDPHADARKVGKKAKRPVSPDWPSSPFKLVYDLEVLE